MAIPYVQPHRSHSLLRQNGLMHIQSVEMQNVGYDADRHRHCDGKDESYLSLCRVLRTLTCCAKVCSTQRSMEERLPSVQCWSASSCQSSDEIAKSRVALFEASESLLDCQLRAHGPRLECQCLSDL